MRALTRLRAAYSSRLRPAQRARDLRLLPGDPAPAGTIRSLADWVRDEGPSGSQLIELPRLGERRTRPAAQTIQAEPHPKLEAIRNLPTDRRALVVAVLPGARLATDLGLVVSPDNQIFAETAWDEEQLAVSGVLRMRRLPRARRLPGTHASLVSQWSDNYSHWLLEALPRTALLVEAGFGDPAFVVPWPLSRFQRDSLQLVGIDDDRLVPFARQHLEPEVLVWPAPPDHAGIPSSWTCRWLRERLAPPLGERPPRPRRLYLSRSGIARPSKRRRVANEADVLAVLKPLGFEVVRPEELSFAEQVRTFAGAEAVVAPHGAALTNLVFSQRARVLELFEETFVNPTYYCLASSAGHDYWYLIGERAGRGDIRVPLDALRETLGRLLTD
jgi:capsular polysaccharide biosynthesis protein